MTELKKCGAPRGGLADRLRRMHVDQYILVKDKNVAQVNSLCWYVKKKAHAEGYDTFQLSCHTQKNGVRVTRIS